MLIEHNTFNKSIISIIWVKMYETDLPVTRVGMDVADWIKLFCTKELQNYLHVFILGARSKMCWILQHLFPINC